MDNKKYTQITNIFFKEKDKPFKKVTLKDAGTILITFPKNNNHKPNHTPQYGC